MPLFYHKYVNYVLAHSVNYVITLYRLVPPVAPILAIPTTLSKAPPPLRPDQPFQNRTIPCSALSHLPPLSKGELLLLSFAQPTIEGLLHHPLPRTNPYHTRKQLYPNKPIYNKKIEFQKTCHRHLF